MKSNKAIRRKERRAKRHVQVLEKNYRKLRNQLPEGMQNCTIRYKQCELGHGWLTATNWVQHGCPTCAQKEAERKASLSDAVSEGILKNRILVFFKEEKLQREGRVALRYQQDRETLYMKGLRDYAISYAKEPYHPLIQSADEFLEVPPYQVGAEQRVELYMSRSQEHLATMIQQVLDHLAHLISRMVWKKLQETGSL